MDNPFNYPGSFVLIFPTSPIDAVLSCYALMTSTFLIYVLLYNQEKKTIHHLLWFAWSRRPWITNFSIWFLSSPPMFLIHCQINKNLRMFAIQISIETPKVSLASFHLLMINKTKVKITNIEPIVSKKKVRDSFLLI